MTDEYDDDLIAPADPDYPPPPRPNPQAPKPVPRPAPRPWGPREPGPFWPGGGYGDG